MFISCWETIMFVNMYEPKVFIEPTFSKRAGPKTSYDAGYFVEVNRFSSYKRTPSDFD